MDTREEVRAVFVGITTELRKLVFLRVAGALGEKSGRQRIDSEVDRVWSDIERSVFDVVRDAVERTNELITPELQGRG